MSEDRVVKIKVIGVGGAGNNVINRMIGSGVTGVDFVVINTDKQDLNKSVCANKVQIGEKLTNGMGAGSKPEVGQKSAEESRAQIAKVLEDTDMEFAIMLPEGVKFMDPDVQTAAVSVKFPNLGTRTLTVSDIQALNVPEGMEVEFLVKSISITIRGDKNLIKNIVPPDIIVTVDFADAQLGSYTVKPNIVLSNTYSSVGAIGSYSVSVTVRSTTE